MLNSSDAQGFCGRYHFFRLLICGIFTFISINANAHAKWFITDASEFSRQSYPIDAISITICACAAIFILVSYWLNRLAYHNIRVNRALYQPLLPNQLKLQDASWPGATLKLAIAVLLLSNILQGDFIAPNFDTGGDPKPYLLLQAGLLLILTISQTMFSISLLAICSLLFFLLPLESTIDYFPELIAIGIALYMNSPEKRKDVYYLKFENSRYKISGANLGLVCLRFGIGLQLIILTFHDKLLSPAYGLAFLSDYPYMNFLRNINASFSQDIYFIFCAGMAELCFGILLVSNIAARLSLALIIFFFMITGFVLDANELLGHLPILVAAGILFVYLPEDLWERTDEELELLIE
jgi:hypothetical protein